MVFPDEGILVESESFFDPEIKSGRSSEDVSEGARVASEEPTGYGATGISVREEADGLYLMFPIG